MIQATRHLALASVCLLVLAGLSACGSERPVAGESGSQELQSGLDTALDEARRSTGAPAATATVMRCGETVWSGASGVTDVASRRLATPDTLFAVASSMKPMTAALVLGLVEDGELSLDANLSRFYPRLPDTRKITIRMLLDHTSGLNEYFDDPQIAHAIVHDPDHHWTRDEVLRGITQTEFEPGTKYAYSNSAYVVLGGIVEKLTGQTIEQAFRERIADPVGMSHSTFVYQPERSHLFAHPYLRTDRGLQDEFAPGVGVPADFWGPVWTDGGLASTSPDLARFADALFLGEIVEPETVRKMVKPNRFDSRLGIDGKSYAGRRWLGHDGRYVGYESELWYDRSRGLTVAVNTDAEKSSLDTWKKLVRAYGAEEPGAALCGA